MTKLCPRGHRVRELHNGRGACGTCENVYPKGFLIPVQGKVSKRNYEIYARAWRAGFRTAMLRMEESA